VKWKKLKPSTTIRTAAIAAVALAAGAGLNLAAARRTERRHPPSGRFIDLGKTRLHFTDEGEGPPVVLLHGNGVTARDWKSSGVIDALVRSHRVIAFDRPGFGYTTRPRAHVWTAAAQARLLHEALHELSIDPAVIVGHSWGTLVALALALEYPVHCRRLLLISGYYFPTFRADVAVFGAPALPIVGDLLRYTISPPLGRLLAPALSAQLFAPADVDPAFAAELPMAIRPWQIRANAEDTMLMIPSAALMERRYKDVTVPVAIVAGAGDKVISPTQSVRLSDEIPDSELLVIEGVGHMVHYTAKKTIAEAIAVMANAQPHRVAPVDVPASSG
jgi:pimeloyl-ACP methyl ester carboxylesterase